VDKNTSLFSTAITAATKQAEAEEGSQPRWNHQRNVEAPWDGSKMNPSAHLQSELEHWKGANEMEGSLHPTYH
jgi:hypothetical protein